VIRTLGNFQPDLSRLEQESETGSWVVNIAGSGILKHLRALAFYTSIRNVVQDWLFMVKKELERIQYDPLWCN
jgi:hypothetical protein